MEGRAGRHRHGEGKDGAVLGPPPPPPFLKFSEADLSPGSEEGRWGQQIQLRDSTVWIQFLAAPHVTSGLFTLSVPHLPHLQNAHNSSATP